MSAFIELCVETRPFERIEADLACAGFFLDERPLRGAAGRADWRLCGRVTELVGSGRLRGKLGEAALVPSMGRLAADRVLLLGLGRRSSFRVGRARDTSHSAVERSLALGVRAVVLAPPVGGPDSFSRHASGIVRGVIEAAKQGSGALRMTLAVPFAEVTEALKSLEKAVTADLASELRWLGYPDTSSARAPQPVSPKGFSSNS